MTTPLHATDFGGGTKSETVRGVSGSEKIPFFHDPRVVTRLQQLGLVVDVTQSGSREIATNPDLPKLDFAFPAGSPAAEKIRKTSKTLPAAVPFYSPIAIGTFRPIAELLVKDGVARRDGKVYLLDLHRYLNLVESDTRWADLGNNTVYNVSKSVLITSTDVRKSNSAAMYLSLASYAANGDAVVQTPAQEAKVLPIVAPLFLKQGFVAASSEEPFDDYLSLGMGKTPLVLIYESQFVGRAALRDGSIQPDMVLMYPSPTRLSKHTFVPITARGQRLGEAHLNDPQLQRLAVEGGGLSLPAEPAPEKG